MTIINDLKDVYDECISSSGDHARIGSSVDNVRIGSSGFSARIGSLGYSARIDSLGYSARIGSLGNFVRVGSSGNSARIGSSGDFTKIDSNGESSVVSSIGYHGVVKAKKGSWITLAEYRDDKVYFVKTEFVDGVKIKEDTYYCLFNNKFREYDESDNVKSAIISERGGIKKVVIFGETKESYLVSDGENFSHGDTLKKAKEDLIYKISNRDTSKYNDMTLDTIFTKADAIKMYRVITGACETGVRNFLDRLDKVKTKYKVSEIVEITRGRYNHELLVKFLKKGE